MRCGDFFCGVGGEMGLERVLECWVLCCVFWVGCEKSMCVSCRWVWCLPGRCEIVWRVVVAHHFVCVCCVQFSWTLDVFFCLVFVVRMGWFVVGM